jgi:hypothetical protein
LVPHPTAGHLKDVFVVPITSAACDTIGDIAHSLTLACLGLLCFGAAREIQFGF